MMDYDSYRKNYFTEPAPRPRYKFTGNFGVTLFYQDFDPARVYYEQVLGPPAYREGAGTVGWQIGESWLTLLQGKSGNPRNVEMTFQVATPSEAELLHQAFINAGGSGPAPSDELMYEPVRYCAVRDPFGVDILIISSLTG